MPEWKALADQLTAAGITFELPPTVRFERQPGGQWTMYFYDPSARTIEVKGSADFESVYAH